MTEIDEGISHVLSFHQHVMHELILFISFPKKNLLQMCDALKCNCAIQMYCDKIVSNRIGLTQPQFENITSQQMAVVTGLLV